MEQKCGFIPTLDFQEILSRYPVLAFPKFPGFLSLVSKPLKLIGKLVLGIVLQRKFGTGLVKVDWL